MFMSAVVGDGFVTEALLHEADGLTSAYAACHHTTYYFIGNGGTHARKPAVDAACNVLCHRALCVSQYPVDDSWLMWRCRFRPVGANDSVVGTHACMP